MLRLLQSIFGKGSGEEQAGYPESLVEAAIERAIDGTDPRLRALPGYHKRLRPTVIRAIDQVVRLVDGLHPPAEVNPRHYGMDTQLSAFFTSIEHLQQVLGSDSTLSECFKGAGGIAPERVVTLLVMEKRERNVLGMEFERGSVRREVPQVTVSFTGHHFVDPEPTEEETRRCLKRRAFDHLLALALGRMAAARAERAELKEQHSLLRHKLSSLQQGGWSFEQAGAVEGMKVTTLESQIEEIEVQLGRLGADSGMLEAHLGTLIEVLSRPQENLWLTPISLIVDRMGIKREHADVGALELKLDELHNAAGRSAIIRLVSIARDVLPPRHDFLREAWRYLG
jgi:hypothetical protein